MRDVKEKVYENCEAFTKLKRSPESYVVGFQIGKVFNDVVALDVGGDEEGMQPQTVRKILAE